MAGSHQSGDNRLVTGIYSGRPLRLFLFATIFVVVVESLLLALIGRGPVLIILPWTDLATESFAILASLSIAYFCLGRWRVLDEPGTLWVGLGFWAYAIFAAMYLLVLPGVVDSGSVLGISPNAEGWLFHWTWTIPGLLLILATLIQWPHNSPEGRRYSRLLFAVTGLICLLISILTFIFAANLPPMAVGGRFTALHEPWIAAMVVMFLLAAFLGLRQYLRNGQIILGYAAAFEVVIAVRLAIDLFGGQYYDVAWYLNRVVVIGAFALMLFALLDEYVGLLQHQQHTSALAQERASQLEATLDSIADAVFVLDAQSNVVDTNPRGVQLLGFSSEKEALRPYSEYQQFLRASQLDGSPLKPEEYLVPRALRGETLRGFLEQAHMWDGRELTLEVSASPIYGAEGAIVGTVIVIRDVTELEWARTRVTVARIAMAVAQVLSLNDLVEAVLETAGEALQADMVLLYSVDEARRQLDLLGQRNVPPEMLKLIRSLPFNSPALGARAATTRSVQVLEDISQAPSELSMPREIGKRFGIGSLISVPLLVRGSSIGIMTYAVRQAQRFTPREMEAISTIGNIIAIGLENARLYDEAQEERGRLTAVIDNSPEAVLLFEAPNGRLVLSNRAADEMTGHKMAYEVPLTEFPQFYGIYHPDGKLYSAEELPSSRALKGETVLGEEVLLYKPSGEKIDTLTNAAPICDAAGQITGAVVVYQDITHIKELERQREEFISVVAHDLRGTLTIIKGYADFLMLMASRASLPEGVQGAVTKIADSSKRMDRMISDLLDVSRIEARRLSLIKKDVDFTAFIQEVVERSEELTKGHQVRLEVQGEIPRVEIDPDRIEQVLDNLLSNAGKYSYPDSEITVEVEASEGEVVVSVTNFGPGISPEDREELFNRFYRAGQAQREVPGLGVGLYIAKGLVEAHGGLIWVESEPNKYATFRFTLPVT